MKDSDILKFLSKKFGGRYQFTPPHRCVWLGPRAVLRQPRVTHRHIKRVK